MSTFLVQMQDGVQMYVWSPENESQEEVRESVERKLGRPVEVIEPCGHAPDGVDKLLVQDE